MRRVETYWRSMRTSGVDWNWFLALAVATVVGGYAGTFIAWRLGLPNFESAIARTAYFVIVLTGSCLAGGAIAAITRDFCRRNRR
jgi:hypothetical protein